MEGREIENSLPPPKKKETKDKTDTHQNAKRSQNFKQASRQNRKTAKLKEIINMFHSHEKAMQTNMSPCFNHRKYS